MGEGASEAVPRAGPFIHSALLDRARHDDRGALRMLVELCAWHAWFEFAAWLWLPSTCLSRACTVRPVTVLFQ